VLKLSALLAAISVGFMVWCLVEAISTAGPRIRNLPKAAWILVILFLPLVGSIAWLVGGRPPATAARTSATPGPDRATRADARNPAEEAADFSTRIRERAEEQRRRYEQQKKKDEDQDRAQDRAQHQDEDKDKPEADKPEADTPEPG
jgi:hypothetical protein